MKPVFGSRAQGIEDGSPAVGLTKARIVVRVLLYWYLKYFVFYVLMMFKNDNYTLIGLFSLRTFEDVAYYCWLFLAFPTLLFVLFSVPTYLFIARGSWRLRLSVAVLVLSAEFIIYTALASSSNYYNGLLNACTSVGVMYGLLRFDRNCVADAEEVRLSCATRKHRKQDRRRIVTDDLRTSASARTSVSIHL
jgi:hypothetical protein